MQNWREIELPPRVAALEKTPQGYPIPYTAAIGADGTADLRVINVEHQIDCIKNRKCSVCGQSLDYWAYFIGGDLALTNMVFSDPALHLECALYSLRVCPYLRRDEAHYANMEKRPPVQLAGGYTTKVDELVSHERPLFMLLMKANQWRLIRVSGMHYAKAARLYAPRYFSNGDEITVEDADALKAAHPVSEERERQIAVALAHQYEDRLARNLVMSMLDLEAGRLLK